MSIEEIENRYVKGYDYTDREHRNQLYNDMEWLMDEVLRLQNKYRNLMNKINEAMEENNKY
jgi:hypothetical protein